MLHRKENLDEERDRFAHLRTGTYDNIRTEISQDVEQEWSVPEVERLALLAENAALRQPLQYRVVLFFIFHRTFLRPQWQSLR